MMGKRMEEHNMEIYTPLIKSLTIRESGIHGLGVFAVTDILENTELGLTHIEVICPYIGEFELIRTPLGGFYNHSNEPNCQKYKVGIKYFLILDRRLINRGNFLEIVALLSILMGSIFCFLSNFYYTY